MKTHILTAAVALSVGAAGTWYFAPRRVEVRTEYKDRWREVTKTAKKRTKTTKKPDGTVISDVTETHTDTKSAGVSTGSTLTSPAPRWNASLMGGVDLKLRPVAGAHVTYRVAGPFTAGVFGIGSPQSGFFAAGLSLGVTF